VAAQNSKAQVIGLANVATETVNTIKQANEFGIAKGGQRLAAFLFFANDVKGLGLEAAQGLYLTSSFYWDLDDKTRGFAKRFSSTAPARCRITSRPRTNSVVMHYLRAIDAAGTDDAKTVVKR